MSAFNVPPLPGENLLTVTETARRAGCSRQAVENAIHTGRMGAVTVAGRILVAESEADRFIREWPTRKAAVSAHWREYRAWKASQRDATLELA